jgi:hypothetical protein
MSSPVPADKINARIPRTLNASGGKVCHLESRLRMRFAAVGCFSFLPCYLA